jgi:hypothetical protein
MDRYECTCGGGNPNCCNCFGTGLVLRAPPAPRPYGRPPSPITASTQSTSSSPSFFPPRPSGRQRSIDGNTLDQIGPVATCPFCNIDFNEIRDLTAHIAVGHRRPPAPLGKAKAPGLGAKTARANRISCPDCKALVRNLQKHQRNFHNMDALARQKAKAERKALRKAEAAANQARLSEQPRGMHDPQPANPGAMRCSICLAFFPSDDSRRSHLRAAHPLKAGAQSKDQIKSASTSGQNRSGATRLKTDRPSRDQDTVYAQEAKERRMDATYGMGGTARDHGQFGSAPSHDAMDDESSA